MIPNDYDQNPATSFYYVFISRREKKKLTCANYFSYNTCKTQAAIEGEIGLGITGTSNKKCNGFLFREL